MNRTPKAGTTVPRTLAVRVTQSAVGPLTIGAGPAGIVSVHFGDEWSPEVRSGGSGARTAGMLLDTVERQLQQYFKGSLRVFDISLDLVGTDFQRNVWRLLRDIPFGERTSYGAIAGRIGDANLARAVGAAAGANPVPILVPCHRVLGADGALTGFAGGLAIKEALLQHEARHTLPGLFSAPVTGR